LRQKRGSTSCGARNRSKTWELASPLYGLHYRFAQDGAKWMRIGIVRSLATTVAGGVFQYEMTLLRAISEMATRFPEEMVYLSTHPADIAPLASVGDSGGARRAAGRT
jgi:hypothetical protein